MMARTKTGGAIITTLLRRGWGDTTDNMYLCHNKRLYFSGDRGERYNEARIQGTAGVVIRDGVICRLRQGKTIERKTTNER